MKRMGAVSKTRTAGVTGCARLEEGGDDVESVWRLCPGPHTRDSGRYNGLQRGDPERIPENRPRFGSQAATACVKLELLVTAGQQTAVNTFPDLAHPARHIGKVGST